MMGWRMLCAVMAALGFLLATGTAEASHCAQDYYDHNGSLMDWSVCDGGGTVIQYVEPRPGLQKIGVTSGTDLFVGKEGPPSTLKGDARIFDAKCGTAKYRVSGRIEGDRIVLKGKAPVRNATCEVVRHRADTLVFTRTEPETDGPLTVSPSCPSGFTLNGDVCVRDEAGAESNDGSGDWYAIAAASADRREAQDKANRLGSGWFVMKTDRCPNFTKGLWIATAGPHAKPEAESYAGGPANAYIKSCH